MNAIPYRLWMGLRAVLACRLLCLRPQGCREPRIAKVLIHEPNPRGMDQLMALIAFVGHAIFLTAFGQRLGPPQRSLEWSLGGRTWTFGP